MINKSKVVEFDHFKNLNKIMELREKIKNLIKELEKGNPYTNNWIIDELQEILNSL